MDKHLYIIDGTAQFYRNYHANFAPLNAPDGEPTKATYLFTQMMMRLFAQHKPTHLAVAWDTPRHLLKRREWCETYKGGRGEQDEDALIQVKRILGLLELMNVPILVEEGWEADDVIATATSRALEVGFKVTIVGRDKDLMQLIEPGVRMFDPQKTEYIDAMWVRERFEVEPWQMKTYQMLVGDGTDNLPGVRGIGPKNAVGLLNRFKTYGSIVENVDVISPPKVRQALQNAIADGSVALMRKLVTLNRVLTLTMGGKRIGMDDLKAAVDLETPKPLFQRLGFRRFS